MFISPVLWPELICLTGIWIGHSVVFHICIAGVSINYSKKSYLILPLFNFLPCLLGNSGTNVWQNSALNILICKIHWVQAFQVLRAHTSFLLQWRCRVLNTSLLCWYWTVDLPMCSAYTLAVTSSGKFCFLHVQSLALGTLLSFFLILSWLQIDLEPEGRVYVIIDLSGSSGEGRAFQYFILFFHEWILPRASAMGVLEEVLCQYHLQSVWTQVKKNAFWCICLWVNEQLQVILPC